MAMEGDSAVKVALESRTVAPGRACRGTSLAWLGALLAWRKDSEEELIRYFTEGLGLKDAQIRGEKSEFIEAYTRMKAKEESESDGAM